MSSSDSSAIVVFGAGGRAGRAITAEAQRRGIRVTGVVRDPGGHPGLTADRVVAGDVLDSASVAALVRGHGAAVHAVSPASGPEALQRLGVLDDRFFVTAAGALLAGLESSGVPRLIVIGLFANLVDAGGRPLFEDPAVFPPELRRFAVAHTAGLDHLRGAGSPVDWLMLTPPGRLSPDAPRTGGYRTGGDRADGVTLSYADLAVAAVDEIVSPVHHRTRIAVFD
ncbi:NAD(P)-dependent oxidoreductase [Actinoplanes couchii]|uniref:NAD(P)-binding domain-containing protein n=1 Tax=Actinoplanes couchii TaxID=403638 RepID=A0ABQ3XMK1_9ACTN|nr:NAD(P)H-binding protein [Actinoplanes couchii]MDR6321596.1 putative NADH-flavin reductase [Actinoplanes couchii]GID59690.1 hypothetical protein Aco03nite_080940 [Actinoplanes couchii]